MTGKKTIKKLRLENNISQEQLSEDSGLSLRTIQRLENGETLARESTLKRIAEVLNVDANNISLQNNEDYEISSGKIQNTTTTTTTILIFFKIIFFSIIGGCSGIIVGYYLFSQDLIEIIMILFASIGALIGVQQFLRTQKQ